MSNEGKFRETMLQCNQTKMMSATQHLTNYNSTNHSIHQVLQRIDKRIKSPTKKYFDWLHLIDIKDDKLTKNYFAEVRFKNLIIQDAPLLRTIHPNALKLVSNLLQYFYAYNTQLDQYRQAPSKSPFGSMRKLKEVHIASASHVCPPKGEYVQMSVSRFNS